MTQASPSEVLHQQGLNVKRYINYVTFDNFFYCVEFFFYFLCVVLLNVKRYINCVTFGNFFYCVELFFYFLCVVLLNSGRKFHLKKQSNDEEVDHFSLGMIAGDAG